MHGFYYLAIIEKKSGVLIKSFKDLTLKKTYLDLDFLSILDDQGIQYTEFEKNQENFDFQLKMENTETPFVFNIFLGNILEIVIVTDNFLKELTPIVERCLNELEKEINDIDSIEPNNLLPKIKITLANNFGEFLLPNFLIPELIENDNSIEISNKDRIVNSILSKLDGTRSIEDLSEELKIDIWILKEKFFVLWLDQQIYFRIRYYPWDLFVCTAKSTFYLDEGSSEYLSLVNKFNSNKIIKILQLIEKNGQFSYQELLQEMDLTQIKMGKYLTELISKQTIRKIDIIPHITKITEDLIPILTLQGFTKEDYENIIQMERFQTGKMSLENIAIEMHVEPSILKKSLDQFEIAMKIIDS